MSRNVRVCNSLGCSAVRITRGLIVLFARVLGLGFSAYRTWPYRLLRALLPAACVLPETPFESTHRSRTASRISACDSCRGYRKTPAGMKVVASLLPGRAGRWHKSNCTALKHYPQLHCSRNWTWETTTMPATGIVQLQRVVLVAHVFRWLCIASILSLSAFGGFVVAFNARFCAESSLNRFLVFFSGHQASSALLDSISQLPQGR